MRYRVFSEDVGKGKFSAVDDTTANSPEEAILPYCTDKVKKLWHGQRIIALPHNRKDLWPHGYTGVVPKEALRYR